MFRLTCARTPWPPSSSRFWLTTTRLRTIDYRLTDAIMDPPGAEALNSEALVRLPRGVVCYACPSDAPAVTPLPARSLGRVTFGSLHKLSKLNPAVLDLWCRILR